MFTAMYYFIVSGAFVAGLDAGLVYNSFPLMAGRIIPSDIFAYAPWLSNFTENPTTVQFNHRILGTSTLAFVTYLAFKARKLPLHPRYNSYILCRNLSVILGLFELFTLTLPNYCLIQFQDNESSSCIDIFQLDASRSWYYNLTDLCSSINCSHASSKRVDNPIFSIVAIA